MRFMISHRGRMALRGRAFRAALWLLASLPPLMLFGILGRWGLPSRANDDLLFGGRPAWEASRLNAGRLEEARRERTEGADTDLDPLTDRSRIIDLTGTEEQRAAILVRYRLYTHQPDEMITLMALARMNPRTGDFDPRLYQYGGLWVYLGGAALVLLKPLLGLSFSLADNLDHPEQFARFYSVLRGLTMLFAIVLIRACQQLLLMAGSRGGALWVGPLLLLMPVFISGALEAKPHLPSVGMTLLACVAALVMLRRPGVRGAALLALSGGASLGLVLTGAVGGALWIALPAVSRRLRERRALLTLLAAGGGALAIYALWNPYLVYNWLFRPEVLASNVGNSTAMYQVGRFGAGSVRVAELMGEGCGWPLLFAGLAGFVLLLRDRPRETLVVAAPGLAMLLLSIAIGADKPAEFGRFLLLPSCGLAICAAYVFGRLSGIFPAVIVVLSLYPAGVYYEAFWKDSRAEDQSRRKAAEIYRQLDVAAPSAWYIAPRTVTDSDGTRTENMLRVPGDVAVIQEPAPYSVPPLDFTRVRVLLLPAERPRDLDPAALPMVLIYTADDSRAHMDAWWRGSYQQIFVVPHTEQRRARITWANKPVFIWMRTDFQTASRETHPAP